MTRVRIAAFAAAAAPILASVTLVYATPAQAAPVDCEIVDREIVCGQAVETPPSPAPTGGGAAVEPASGSAPTAFWTREVLPSRRPEGDANSVDYCTTPDGQPGTLYRDTLVSVTGEVLDTVYTCIGEADPADSAIPAAVAPPPPPPTREELLDRTRIPDPTIQRNPSGRGLAGLTSLFWAAVDPTVEASVSLRGWTITGTLGVGDLAWDTGDGGHYQTTSPGTAEDPAVEHTYQQDGTWPVSLDMTWSGSYTVSGFGTTYTVDDLTATGTAAVDYEVIEIRGVLDDPARE